jgi:hypothetical protein
MEMRSLMLGVMIAGPLTAAAWGQATLEPQRVVVPLSDASRPPEVHVSLVNGGVTVEAYPGKEVIVEARGRQGDGDEGHEATSQGAPRGMRRIPNVSLGLVVEERDNVVSVQSESWNRAIDIRVQVPARSSVKLGCVNDGDIHVKGVSGEIETSNVNGEISILDAAGAVTAETVNGDVKVVLKSVEAGKAMAFSSFNGNVDVTFPAATRADVVLRSDQGEIYTDFDVDIEQTPPKVSEDREGGRFRVKIEKEIRGKVNGGGPEIRFKTYNGDIYLRRGS